MHGESLLTNDVRAALDVSTRFDFNRVGVAPPAELLDGEGGVTRSRFEMGSIGSVCFHEHSEF